MGPHKYVCIHLLVNLHKHPAHATAHPSLINWPFCVPSDPLPHLCFCNQSASVSLPKLRWQDMCGKLKQHLTQYSPSQRRPLPVYCRPSSSRKPAWNLSNSASAATTPRDTSGAESSRSNRPDAEHMWIRERASFLRAAPSTDTYFYLCCGGDSHLLFSHHCIPCLEKGKDRKCGRAVGNT